jgi:membrane-bound serine protease (ClpP class)
MFYNKEIFWIVITIAILVVVALIYFLKKDDALILNSSLNSEEGFTSLPENLKKIIHSKGITVTPMTPSGIIEINGVRFDAQSRGEYIEAGKEVEVIGFDTVTPVVKLV